MRKKAKSKSTPRRLLLFFLFILSSNLLLEAEEITVAVFDNAAPVTDIDEDGKPFGFFPDMLKNILKDLNYTPRLIPFATFQEAYAAVQSGDVDIMPALIKTPEREQELQFNNESFMINWSEVFCSRKTTLNTLFDLRGKKIGLMQGDQNGKSFLSMMDSFGISFKPVYYPSFRQMSDDIVEGRIEAGVFFSTYFQSEPRLKPTNIVFNPSEAYIGLSQERDPALLDAIDARLAELKQDDSSYYYALLKKYMMVQTHALIPRWILPLVSAVSAVALIAILFSLLLQRAIRRIRKEIYANEAKYKSLFDKSDLLILLIEPQTNRIVDANRAAIRFYGYSYHALLKMNVSELSVSSEEEIANTIRRAMQATEANIHAVHRTASGEERYMDIHIGPVSIHGQELLLGFLLDETEKVESLENLNREKERTEKALKVKEEFLANISHELRTPLNGVIGMLSLLENLELQHDERYFLNLAQESAENLFEIIRDLLDFSRLDTGQLGILEEVFNLEEAAEMAVEFIRPKAQQKGLALETEIRLEKPSYAGDRTRILQIMIHLLSNAIKYSEHGTVRLSLKNKEGLCITVSDEGIGIAPEMQDEIFSSFHQLESPYTKRNKGIGLGLTIVNELLKLMNGSISVDSSEGEGSVFTVRLPANFQEVDAPQEAEPEKTPAIEHSSGKIMIVEDEAINRIYLSRLLGIQGYTVIEASDGYQAVERCVEENPDLVLMDISLPKMNGIEATKKIHSIEKYRDLPIIALTAHAHSDDIETFLKAGMAEVVTKPINEEDLYATLNKCLTH